MTTSHDIDALLAAFAADPSDRTTRLVLADALADAGRDGEADALRGDGSVTLLDGEVLGDIRPADVVSSTGGVIGYDDPLESYDWFDAAGGRFEMELYLQEGEHPTPAGGAVTVYRWVQWQDRYVGGVVAEGPWRYSRDEAAADAERRAEEDAN